MKKSTRIIGIVLAVAMVLGMVGSAVAYVMMMFK